MRIQELTLEASSIEALQEFYSAKLQLPVVRTEDSLLVNVGASVLNFRQGAGHRYHFAVNIPENQIAACQNWLKQRVPLLQDEDSSEIFNFDTWEAHSVYFLDPAGNIVECIARHRLHNASPQPFSSAGFLNISEIGLASSDVVQQVQELAAQLSAPYFQSPDGPNPNFTAIGDDHGLVILVKQGRIWYPNTEVPAKTAPTRILIEGQTTPIEWGR
jgi:catechol-2,3-dioxygenase